MLSPSCCLPPGGGRGVWATCPSCPLAAHQHAVPAALRGSLLALCLQGYGQVALAGKQRVLARLTGPHWETGSGRNPGFPKLPSLVLWLLSVSCPQEGTSFPLKASCALSNTGPCAGPPGTRCPVVELDRKWSGVTSSDDSGCKEEAVWGDHRARITCLV